jgi:hypothetical protein
MSKPADTRFHTMGSVLPGTRARYARVSGKKNWRANLKDRKNEMMH